MDRKTYHSSASAEPLRITAPYYNAINPTTVFFAQEKVLVFMNALGHIEFFDENEISLGAVDVPVSKDPSKYAHTAQYGEVLCAGDGKTITLSLPVYWWSDSYPHCDGESDRWSRHIDYWFRIVFDCESKTLTVQGQ